jgi:alpha-tubulin suppressor-like RCC1 family protein
MDGDADPNAPCQACTITTSTSLWTAKHEGDLCGVGKSCQSNICSACGAVGQACCGTVVPGNCAMGAACNASTNQCQADKAIDISGTEDTVCALFQSGRVRCWGTNGTMLGASGGSNVAAPPIAGLEDAVNISVGYHVACAVRATGAVVCWGSELPGGGSSALPVVVPNITTAMQVSAGKHSCARTRDSKMLCWGDNSHGELGVGTTNTTATSTPQEMLGVTDAVSARACGEATCVLHSGGQASCTGVANQNGLSTDASTLSDIPGLAAAASLSCQTFGGNQGYFCAVTQTGTLICWGSSLPANVLGAGQPLSAIGSSYNGGYYFAIQPDHTLWALGTFNFAGQLGDGTFTDAATIHRSPRLIHDASPVSNVVAVAGATDTYGNYPAICLLRSDGSVSCAGENGRSSGTALGDGQQSPLSPRAYFVPVVGILPVASEDGQCYDGVDNDGDGETDLDDSDCAQDLGSSTANPVATVAFRGVFGNYLHESCNGTTGGYGGPEAVLTWTAPSGGTFQFDTTGSSFDTVLAAYKGNPLTSAELACNDDGTGLTGGASAIQVKVITGDKLTLVVDSKAAPNAPASFNLNITKQ